MQTGRITALLLFMPPLQLGINVRDVLLENKQLRQQLALQSMAIAQQSAQFSAVLQSQQLLLQEMYQRRLGQAAHAAADGVRLPAPAPEPLGLPAGAPTPLAALLDTVGQVQLAQSIAEVQQQQQQQPLRSGSPSLALMQLLPSQAPQLQLLASPNTLRGALPSGPATQMLSAAPPGLAPDVQPRALFRELPSGPSAHAGSSSEGVGAADAVAGSATVQAAGTAGGTGCSAAPVPHRAAAEAVRVL